MSEFKTRAEMATALEFIQYLEVLVSGSLANNDGINRSLQRLAENLDGVLDALQAARMIAVTGGGTGTGLTWNSGTGQLAWESDLRFNFPAEVGGAEYNVLPVAESFISLPTNGNIAYVIFDRTTTAGVLTKAVAADMTAFLAAIAGQSARLDWFIIATRTADGVTLWNNHKLRNAEALTNNLYTDTQYGQQTEVTLIRDNQKENLKLIITEGGILSWDVSPSEEFSWSLPLKIEFPGTAGGENTISTGASPLTIPEGYAAYLTLDRAPVGSSPVTLSVVDLAVGVPSGDDIFVFAIHKDDGRLYLWNGQAFSDGDTALLGGLRSGVQWFYNEAGAGAQVTDFAPPSTRTYTLGSGELMVYRNGKKALNVSDAWWDAGAGDVYPNGPGLVGVISPFDEYLEVENTGTGEGSTIVWLRDDVGGGEAAGHAAGTHDIPWTWPAADDYIQAFIGIMGNGPSPVEGLGIFGDGGDILEGQVKLEAGFNIGLAYAPGNNSIVVSQNAASVSIELDGGAQGAQIGPLVFKEPSLVNIDDTVAGEFSFDLATPYKAAVENATLPTATNPFAVLDALSPIQGFDSVYGEEPSPAGPAYLRTFGGRLISNGVVYISNSATGPVDAGATDLYPGDALIPSEWHYIYLSPAGAPGGLPVMEIANGAPVYGEHALDATRKFLASFYVTAGSDIILFHKRRGWAELSASIDVTSAFSGLNASGWQHVDLYGSAGYLNLIPNTAVKLVRLTLQVDIDSGPTDLHTLLIRAEGRAATKTYQGTEPEGGNTMTFEILAPIGRQGGFDINLGGTFQNPPVLNAWLIGYAEGYESADRNLGVY
jgi:hypothetical protein